MESHSLKICDDRQRPEDGSFHVPSMISAESAKEFERGVIRLRAFSFQRCFRSGMDGFATRESYRGCILARRTPSPLPKHLCRTPDDTKGLSGCVEEQGQQAYRLYMVGFRSPRRIWQ